jgi:hypothetical protein
MDKKFEDLTYSQQLNIAHEWINDDDIVSISELLLQTDEINQEVITHPDYLMALPLVNKDPNWKDYMAEAELDVCARWAYKIYLHVKGIVEKEEQNKG